MTGRERAPRPRRGVLPLVILALASLEAGGRAHAEPPPLEAREPPRYTADVLVFHEEDRDEAMVWLVIHCPVTSLFFEPGADSTDVRLAWKVRRGKRQIDGDVLVRRVEVAGARRDDAAVLQTIPVRLEPGRYEIEIDLGQPGAESGSVVSRELEVGSVAGKPFALSSLFLSAEPPERIGRRNGGLPGFPLVRRMVSEDVQHVTLVGEIYAPSGCRERFRVQYRLLDDYDRVIQQRSEDVPCEGFRTPLKLPLDTTKLVFGDYRVELTMDVPRARDEVYRELWFSADETLLPLKANFTRTLEVIEVIASEEEMSALREAAPGEREDLWYAFWEARDTDPDTGRNEYKEEFFARLRYANTHFGTGTTRGWKTDRGRTLLKHGHPDRVQRMNRASFGSDARAVEQWEYYDDGLTFVFVDDVGLGDFRLVESSRG